MERAHGRTLGAHSAALEAQDDAALEELYEEFAVASCLIEHPCDNLLENLAKLIAMRDFQRHPMSSDFVLDIWDFEASDYDHYTREQRRLLADSIARSYFYFRTMTSCPTLLTILSRLLDTQDAIEAMCILSRESSQSNAMWIPEAMRYLAEEIEDKDFKNRVLGILKELANDQRSEMAYQASRDVWFLARHMEALDALAEESEDEESLEAAGADDIGSIANDILAAVREDDFERACHACRSLRYWSSRHYKESCAPVAEALATVLAQPIWANSNSGLEFLDDVSFAAKGFSEEEWSRIKAIVQKHIAELSMASIMEILLLFKGMDDFEMVMWMLRWLRDNGSEEQQHAIVHISHHILRNCLDETMRRETLEALRALRNSSDEKLRLAAEEHLVDLQQQKWAEFLPL